MAISETRPDGITREIKRRWLVALRSGRYQQGRHALRQRTPEGGLEYCCVGVLCNVISPDAWTQPRHDGTKQVFDWQSKGVVANAVQSAGLTHVGLRDNVFRKLAGMNDDEGFSFETIADWIERHVDVVD